MTELQEVHPQAGEIEDFLKNNPAGTVDEIADATGLEHLVVVDILDTHYVNEDGSIAFNGEGLGGGWHPARVAEAEAQQRMLALFDEQIAERQTVLANFRDDADPEIVHSVRAMVEELQRQRAEITGPEA